MPLHFFITFEKNVVSEKTITKTYFLNDVRKMTKSDCKNNFSEGLSLLDLYFDCKRFRDSAFKCDNFFHISNTQAKHIAISG